MSSKFRVLSLSGGGIRGVYTASFLAKLEELTGKRVADHFDLIVGTSTGGLIALAMGMEQTAASIRDFYLERGSEIFTKPSFLQRVAGGFGWTKPKYNSTGLKKALQERFGADTLLGHSRSRLVVNAIYAEGCGPRCFKTRHHESYDRDHRLPAWDVGMATAAAPTYFPAYRGSDGRHHIDGGLWANCPVMVGLVEAIGVLGYAPSDVEVLSIGTCWHETSVDISALNGGKLQHLWVKRRAIHEVILESQRIAIMNMARLLVGRDRLMEIDSVVEAGRFEMDHTSEESLRGLRALGEDLARTKADEIKGRFFSTTAAPFTPVPL
ncbi:MAG: patatin-like phospholipase family protein [Phycisphaeraceae bacterium]|nr:patatin-like phospholipase family protein [Phycisphaeraceae bacterium]